jgi:outer membrane lipoprotein SlyB
MAAGCEMSPRTLTRVPVPMLAMLALLGGCATQTTGTAPAAAPVAPPRPSPSVFFYPLQGQSAEQQDRDRYDCYRWARQQTGYDPSLPQPAGSAPVTVQAVPPPGYGVAAGAATGAVIGAAVSHPWDTPEGAAIGAVAGAMIGAAADASRQQQAERIEAQENASRAQANAQSDAIVAAYRDAMKACLSARGYAVQ